MKDEQSADDVASAIAVVRQAWLDAVRERDVERLGAPVTDDVVVVHGHGRCLCGKEELKADFRKSSRVRWRQLQAKAPARSFFSASSSSRRCRPCSFIILIFGA